MNKKGAFFAGAASGVVVFIGAFAAISWWWVSSSKVAQPSIKVAPGAPESYMSSSFTGHVWFSDQEKQIALKKALAQEKIPYLISFNAEGRETISWDNKYDAAAKQAQASLFGERPPVDRSLCSNPPDTPFKQWLQTQNISFVISKYHGYECVIWAEADKSAVAKWKPEPAPCKPSVGSNASNLPMQPNIANCARSSADRTRYLLTRSLPAFDRMRIV